jgi:hypothetical protein
MARRQITSSQGPQKGLQLATAGMASGIAEVVLGLIWIFVFVGILGAGSLAQFLQQFLQQ